MKRTALRLLTRPAVAAVVRPVLRNHATIFMLHRFHDPERGVPGHAPEVVRRGLAYLRRHRYDLIGLEEMFRRSREGIPLEGSVVFTIDDGYRDQAAIAGPLFAEFDCPVTVFLTTGFLDRLLWFWWDRIEYVFAITTRTSLQTVLSGKEVDYHWDDDPGRRRARLDFTARCKEVPDAEKLAAITRLAAAAGVELPEAVPPEYAPMSWDDARAWEARGMRFGPHTVTHPILARADDAQAERELRESWLRLKTELAAPSPVFCYPNGRRQDFGRREVAVLESLGFSGAVIGEPGYADARRLAADPGARFEVPRFSYQEDIPNLVQCVSGMERVKSLLRGRA